MKTKLYSLLTGLLMAACITSYGQEIVNLFNIHEENHYYTGCDIQENKDGTLLVGMVCCNNPDLYNPKYLIYKTTPDGEILATLNINTPDGMEGEYFIMSIAEFLGKHFLFRNATTDSYIVANHYRNMIDNDHYFRMVSIDADLNVNNDISIQVAQDDEGLFTWDKWFIDTQNDFIVSFWTDNVFHVMRIGQDGAVEIDREISELFPEHGLGNQPDTVLYYSSFGVYSETPLTYYKLGGYRTASNKWPVHCYFFDEDFNITGTHWFESYDGEILFNGGNIEHIVPLDENSYLLASKMEYPNNEAGSALVKYDRNHNPICISPELGDDSYPLGTVITDDNTIYQAYVNNENSSESISLACLNNALELQWDIALPGLLWEGLLGASIMAQPNKDIIIGFQSEGYNDEDEFYTSIFVYTVHNTPANVPENTAIKYPFTLYPSPVKDILSLNFDDGVEPESIELYDLQGRLVSTKQNGLENIDMGGISAGVYTLRVTMKNGTSYREKIVKQ